MIEIIKHAFGLCGEGHVTIFHILGMIAVPFIAFKNYVKLGFKILISKFNKKNESLQG